MVFRDSLISCLLTVEPTQWKFAGWYTVVSVKKDSLKSLGGLNIMRYYQSSIENDYLINP